MNKTIENDFFKWYEHIARKYIEGYGALYEYLYIEEYEDENRNALRVCIDSLKNDLHSQNYQFIKDFDSYSPLWSEISINLQECKNIYSYSYYLLKPFEPIIRALNDDKTDRTKYIQHTLGHKISKVFLESEDILELGDIEVEMSEDDLSFEELDDDYVVHFIVEFGSRLLEEYNLSGYDFEEICNHLHIPLFPIVRAYNLGAMPFKIASGQKYFPIYDRRLLHTNIPQDEKAKPSLPDALNTDYVKELFTKAIDKRLCEEDGDLYKWNKTFALFGYFVKKVNEKLRPEARLSWEPFKIAFQINNRNLQTAKNFVSSLKNGTANKPDGFESVDDIL